MQQNGTLLGLEEVRIRARRHLPSKLTIERDSKESESYELFTLSLRQNAPITVSLRVNQVEATVEVDMGASASIMSETTY